MTITTKAIQLTETRLKQIDPSDMLGKTLELDKQIQRGIEIADEFLLHNKLRPEPLLDWFGLGGSAVSGDLLQAFGMEPPAVDARIFVRRHMRNSQLPRLVCSYSGNTVEAVQALTEVDHRQIWLAVSSGGRLEQKAHSAGIPFLNLPGGYPPRAAVGFSLGAIHRLFQRVYDFMDPALDKWPLKKLREDAERYANLSREENPALDLAVKLVDRTPVIYTCDGLLGPALAFRFRAQLAENSKIWSHASDLPELAHNEVEAFAHLAQVLPPPLVMFLGDWAAGTTFADPRSPMEEMLEKMGVATLRLDPTELFGAGSRLEHGIRLMLLIDAATVYLAILRAEDPMEIPKITGLKNLLTGA
jgi:glucose/mannose-6-phosphate isomerase